MTGRSASATLVPADTAWSPRWRARKRPGPSRLSRLPARLVTVRNPCSAPAKVLPCPHEQMCDLSLLHLRFLFYSILLSCLVALLSTCTRASSHPIPSFAEAEARCIVACLCAELRLTRWTSAPPARLAGTDDNDHGGQGDAKR